MSIVEEIIKEEFLAYQDTTEQEFMLGMGLLGIEPLEVVQILNGKPITERQAEALSNYFNTSQAFWINLNNMEKTK